MSVAAAEGNPPTRDGPRGPWVDDNLLGPTLLSSLWRSRVVVALVTVVAGAAGFALSSTQPVVYEAEARLYLRPPGQSAVLEPGRPADVADLVPQQTARVESRRVFAAAAEQLGGGVDVEGLRERVEVVGDVPTLVISITARAPDGDQAADIANAVATAYRTVVRDERRMAADAVESIFLDQVQLVDAEIERLSERLGDDDGDGEVDDPTAAALLNAHVQRQLQLSALVQDTRLRAEVQGDGVDQFDPAVAPDEPASWEPAIIAVLSAALAFGAAGLWAYWRHGRRRTAIDPFEPGVVLDLPLLGQIPAHADLDGASLVRDDPELRVAYEQALVAIEAALDRVNALSVVVVSPRPGDGRTTAVLRLSDAAGRAQRQVAIVDADTRSPGITARVLATGRPGLHELGSGAGTLRDVLITADSLGDGRVRILPTGGVGDDGTKMLRSTAFRSTLRELAAVADLTIVDTPPLLDYADATVVAGSVGAVVLLINRGTPYLDLEQVRQRLQSIPVPVVGYLYRGAGRGHR